MRLGERMTRYVTLGDCLPVKHEGTVVWIHPERRFYVLRFDCPQGRSFCESYYFPSRGGVGMAGAATPSKGKRGPSLPVAKPEAEGERKKRSFL